MLASSHGDSGKRLFRSALVATAMVLCLSVVVPASAAIMTTTQTLSIPLTQTNWQAGTAGLPNPLEFKKFDPSLGTLNSVQISLDYKFGHDISLTFASPSTLTESTKDSKVIVTAPDGTVYLTANPNSVSQSRTVSSGPFPQTVTIPTISQNGTQGPLTLSTPADLALFTGKTATDKIGLPVSASSNSQFTSSTGNGGGRIVTNAAADVTVTYSYTPVPEPTTLAIFGVTSAILLAYKRRSRRV